MNLFMHTKYVAVMTILEVNNYKSAHAHKIYSNHDITPLICNTLLHAATAENSIRSSLLTCISKKGSSYNVNTPKVAIRIYIATRINLSFFTKKVLLQLEKINIMKLVREREGTQKVRDEKIIHINDPIIG